jgi:predicted acyltransferase
MNAPSDASVPPTPDASPGKPSALCDFSGGGSGGASLPAQGAQSAAPTVPAGGQRMPRLVAIDAYRGLVMFLMMAEVLSLWTLAQMHPDAGWAKAIAFHTTHVEWVGCSLHDLIQPSFSFLVGVALVYSVGRRRASGETHWKTTRHAAWRALALILLGIFLRSLDTRQTYFTFEDTLTQIGLGYFFLYLLALGAPKVQWAALGALLAGYWLVFALYPAPPPDFNWMEVGVDADWGRHLSGFAAHWDKNSNAAWAFDRWFLNLFPREAPFTYNDGGYATLSFIPTLATMLLGLLAGNVLRSARTNGRKVLWLGAAAVVCWLAGLGLHAAGICPIVKRIWTPAWTLLSGGSCFAFLAAFFLVCEVWKLRRWAFPLVVIGMNSIAAYLIAHLFHNFFLTNWHTHFGHPFLRWGENMADILDGAVVLLLFWLCLFWMWRRKIFLKI